MDDVLNASFSSEGRNHVDKKGFVYSKHLSSNNHHQIVPMREKNTWNRLVDKDGRCTVSPTSRAHCWRYVVDFFTTSVDMPWRYNIAMVVLGFFLNWFVFGCIYYVLAFIRGDFDNLDNEDWKPCFRNFDNWKSAFMFSIETQTTIGYGYRCPTEDCGEVMFFLMIQTIWANFIEAFIIASLIAKFSRPKMRARTIIFSKTACITMKDGKLIFQFRVGDLQKSPIVEGHLRLQLVKHYVTKEGSYMPFQVFDMNIGHDLGLDRIFLVWPIQIVHVINKKSPLYEISKETLLDSKFEIIAILEGIVEATGTTTQARTSYLPNEIEWGYDFKTVVTEKKGVLDVNLNYFHHTALTDTTPLSAKELQDSLAVASPGGSDGDFDRSGNHCDRDNEASENRSNTRKCCHMRNRSVEIEPTL
ncbi:G protein-activated inward rectifier potassium channel 2-like [Anneissia japonica]|uniref:G protein-activated inward rectifier potassium channel 2-like n=1 Tax=Anneissia japonica TaxID=1529436 RepID=UPI00142582AE|nr:G protein-activated inward rectifier potassium channel 2-like [Anneissia japonica]